MPAGYAQLFAKFGLDADLLSQRSVFRDDTSPPRWEAEGPQLVRSFPASYRRGDADFDDLVFALKYDGVDPYALVQVLRRTDHAALRRRILQKPTSGYGRLIFFLCERLAKIPLDLPDAKEGGWRPVLSPKAYFVAEPQRSTRHRVLDNLLGDATFCPVVRRTPRLGEAVEKRLDEKADNVARRVEPQLLARAIWYVYAKETRSSFAIEREEPGDRTERYVEQLAAIARLPLETEEGLVELQNSLVDARYAESGYRTAGSPEVYVGETIGFRERVHHIGAPSETTPQIMAGWCRMREVTGVGGAVVEAACRSFAFVFIHPFRDGNGRIHRLLLHHVLARRRFTPGGFIVPISSVIVRNMGEYDAVLERFSSKVMRHTRYDLNPDGELSIQSSDVDLYRYPDLTVQVEATFQWLERAIDEDLAEEIEFLQRFDQVRERMREIVEMPDQKEQLFINLCRTNGGRLSNRKRGKFEELDDSTIEALEAVVQEFLGPRAPGPLRRGGPRVG